MATGDELVFTDWDSRCETYSSLFGVSVVLLLIDTFTVCSMRFKLVNL